MNTLLIHAGSRWTLYWPSTDEPLILTVAERGEIAAASWALSAQLPQ